MMHIFCGIDTDPITYPIDVHWRWRLTPMLCHIPCGRVQVPYTPTHAYIPSHTENSEAQNILSSLYQIKYKIYYDKTPEW